MYERAQFETIQGVPGATRKPASIDAFDRIDQDADIPGVTPKQYTGRGGCAISFATVHKARL